MAGIDGNSLLVDWYNTYVAPRKKPITMTPEAQDMSLGTTAGPPAAPIEGVFSRKNLAMTLGAPTVPAPKIAAPTTFPTEAAAPPENPIETYTPDPNSILPKTDLAPSAAGETKKSEGISPGAMGLLGAGFSMMATPPRAVPYSNMEIFGRGGQAGLAMYEKALEDKRRQQALDISSEEHRLSREDQAIYRRGVLEVAKQNAASSELLKTAASHDREAAAKAKEALQKPISKVLAEYYKLDPATTVEDFNKMQQGIVQTQKPKPTAWREVNFNGKNQWVDLNSPEAQDLAKQGAFGVKDKPGYAYFIADDGSIREIQKGAPEGTPPKVVAPPGTGKKTKPGGAGGPKQFEYQDQQAKASLVQKGIPEPTIEQIAQERQKLFPKGATKANARNPRAMMAPKNGHEYLKQASDYASAKERIRLMAKAGYTRAQIDEAVKGTPWE